MGGMDHPERPTEAQILGWLSRSQSDQPRCAPGRPRSLPRLARILWLRYCAEPPTSLEAIGDELGHSSKWVSGLAQQGLALLAHLEVDGQIADGWDPESRFGRAVIQWRLWHRPFIPRPRLPDHG
jgi:hypothetical protein